MAVTAPSNLTATVKSSSRIYLTWTNEDSYHLIQIWQNIAGAGYALLDTIPGFNENYDITDLAASTEHCYKLKGEKIEPPEESDYSAEDCATTYSTLQVPTNLVATAISDTEIEITFNDNCTSEDDHRLEMKEGAGAYSEVATIAANVEYYKKTGLTKGSTYTFKVRAKEGISYSGYSNEDSATTISEPSAPADLAATDIQDRSLRLTWTGVANETGYKIEKSTTGVWGGEEEEIGKIRADIHEYLVEDLEPSTAYYFRVKAYNAAGDSTPSGVVNPTTLAAYSESEYEKFIRKPVMDSCFLLEFSKLRCDLNLHYCFTLTSGQTNTYEIDIGERGIDIEAVYEDGGTTSYTERTTIALVEANASSFYFDYWNGKLYIHTSGSDDPAKYFLIGEFKLYLSNKEDMIFNNNYYYPLLKEANIPDISQEIKPYYEGNFSISAGLITIINGLIKEPENEYYFDRLYSKFIWRNAKAELIHGEASFSYSDYQNVFTGIIDRASINDDLITINLRDFRDEANIDFPLSTYTQDEFPFLEEGKEDLPIPKQFGYKADQLPVWIDFNDQKCKFHDGRVHSVTAVKINGTTKTENTDYYVDYQRGIITFDRDGITIVEDDIIEVSYFGIVDSALELINNGAEIFLEIMLTNFGKALADLNLDTIYKAKYNNTAELSIHLYQEGTTFEEIIRNIEHTIKCASFQDKDGKIGLIIDETEPASNIRTIENHQIFNLNQYKSKDSLFKTVNVFYKENTQDNVWQKETGDSDPMDWKYGIKSILDVYTYFENNYDAVQLKNDILELLDKDFVSFSIDRAVYGIKPGDLIYFNKDRFRNAAGEAINLILKVFTYNKLISQKKTQIIGTLIDFLDNFDNQALHQLWTKHRIDSDRTIVEASDLLTIAIANNAHGDWWYNPAGNMLNDSPKVIMEIPGTPAEFITKLNSYTVNDWTQAGIFIASDAQGKTSNGAYLFGRFNNTNDAAENGLKVARITPTDVSYVAVTTLPIWLKIKVTEKDNSDVHFLYSTDGEDYILLHTASSYYQIGYYIGLFAKNWAAGWGNISAPFESFKMIRY